MTFAWTVEQQQELGRCMLRRKRRLTRAPEIGVKTVYVLYWRHL